MDGRVHTALVGCYGTRMASSCPICGRPTGRPTGGSSEHDPGKGGYPFCSPRCKLVDLGNWLDGGYRIAGPPVDVAAEAAAAARDAGGRASKEEEE